jgi:hypothetical protein
MTSRFLVDETPFVIHELNWLQLGCLEAVEQWEVLLSGDQVERCGEAAELHV